MILEMATRTRFLACASMLALATGWAGHATAQVAPSPAPTAGSSVQIEEIIVTAQRRSEKLLDVPIAVSAVAAARLEGAGVGGSKDLHMAVPALYIGNAIGFAEPRLRGIGSTTVGPGIENSVAMYVDGVYYASSASNLLSFSNIERVEVLKGPQGTLFGRNATGGLLQVITREPTHELSGSINLGYANYNATHVDGYVSGGLSEHIAADIAFQYDRRTDGWGRNVTTNQPVDTVNYDAAVRSKIVYTPTDATKITVAADYSTLDGNPVQTMVKPGTLTFTGQVASYPGRYDTADTQNDHLHTKQYGASLHVEHDFGSVSLVAITAGRASEYHSLFDFDATALPFVSVHLNQDDRQFSQEFQLQSNPSDSPLSWTAGVYYFSATGKYNPLSVEFGPAAAALFGPAGFTMRTFGEIKTTSIAGYLQGTYELTSDTNLTLGARYTDEKKTLSGSQSNFVGLPDTSLLAVPTPQAPAQTPARAHPLTFRVALDHHFGENTMGYISLNRGFKSGGFNAGNLADPAYAPETLDAYEAGIKTAIFDRRLLFNVSAFYYDYKNIQIAKIENASSGIVNGPTAKVYGVDVDFEARITREFHIDGGLTALNDKLGTYLDAPIGTVTGGFPQHSGPVTGNQLPLAAKLSLSVEPSYTFDLDDMGTLRLAAAYYYSSGWKWEVDNLSEQKAFEQLNISANWKYNKLSATVWVNNVTDVQVMAATATNSLGEFFTAYRAPRTYGLTLGYKF